MRILCSIDCAVLYGKAEAERKQLRQKAEARKNGRKELAARKAKIKTLSDWLREAQKSFNAFIRARDADLSCVSCGRFHQGKWNAGHYRTVAAAGHLRFDERNVHKQCEPCNSHLSGNITKYREQLICKIGEQLVCELENDNRTHRWTVEELAAIKKEYAAKYRELTKTQGLQYISSPLGN